VLKHFKRKKCKKKIPNEVDQIEIKLMTKREKYPSDKYEQEQRFSTEVAVGCCSVQTRVHSRLPGSNTNQNFRSYLEY
jgi:hypothetical protein